MLINKTNIMDYFENLEALPDEIRSILEKYAYEDSTYEMCSNLVNELESVGWTCDYYLDAEPFDLRPIGEPSNY